MTLVAGRDQQSPEADHLGEPVLDPLGRPRILDAAGQAGGDPEAALDLCQHQYPAVRAQPAAITACTLELLGDDRNCTRLARIALDRARLFTWQRAAELAEACVRRCYEDAGAGRGDAARRVRPA